MARPNPTPTRRLALFFDGTSDTPGKRTNVWRAHELLAGKDAAGVPQLKTYIQGVGTNIGRLAAGNIFGAGISRNMRKGYRWLVKNHQDGAEIYVFGFSRGAFTARSFVQMIATCGLTRPKTLSEWSAEQTFRRYAAITRQQTEKIRPIWRLRHWREDPGSAPAGWTPTPADKRLMDESKVRVVKVRMAGLWETVGAIGKDVLNKRVPLTQKSATHNVRPTQTQEYGYHALAIDEQRPMFDVTLWRTFVVAGKEAETMARYAKYYEQRWFIGAHSDVGGGYGDDRLPDLSLRWIMKKSSDLGLAFIHDVRPRADAWSAPFHDSFKSFVGGALTIWDKVFPGDQRLYREMGRLPKTVDTVDGNKGVLWSIRETIDPSVLRRWTKDRTYRPPSLADYFRRNPAPLPAGTGLAQRTQRICANRYWNRTGIFLRPGVSYRIAIVPDQGEPLRDKNNIARSIEGEDWSGLAYKAAALAHGKRKDDAKWFALVGTVEKKHPWIMKEGAVFTAPAGGQLLCYFNDMQMPSFYKNNSGWVLLDVEQV